MINAVTLWTRSGKRGEKVNVKCSKPLLRHAEIYLFIYYSYIP